MLARPVVRDVVAARQPVLQVVGGQDRVVADLAQARPAVRADVGVRAHQDARVADEAAQPPDRGRPLADALEAERAVVIAQDARGGQVRDERLPHPDRTGARAAAAVRRRERLVDVEMHDVEAGLARLEPAEDRVQVGAVHVGQGARLVDRVEQLADARLEQPEGRRVGDHHRGGPRPERRAERVDVDATVGCRRDGDRREAGHRRRRGVRPVARVRDEDLVALGLATGAVVGPDHQDAGQLALGAGRRLEASPRASRRSRPAPARAPTAAGACPGRPRPAPSGGGSAKPGRRAAHSLSLGLNFIVHEPSG